MSNTMKNAVVKVCLAVLVVAVIGVGAYRAGKNRSQNPNDASTESVSARNESEGQGKTLYVSPDGNDTNPGTKDLPKKTVNSAVNSAKEGDTIVAKPKSTSRTSSG